jgi:hypothetical protein
MYLKKTIIISISIIFIILLSIIILFLNPIITGETIKIAETKNTYTHTKAICNQSNFCQDYEISCDGNKTISSKPLTGAVIQHSDDWKDPRNNPKELCK